MICRLLLLSNECMHNLCSIPRAKSEFAPMNVLYAGRLFKNFCFKGMPHGKYIKIDVYKCLPGSKFVITVLLKRYSPRQIFSCREYKKKCVR